MENANVGEKGIRIGLKMVRLLRKSLRRRDNGYEDGITNRTWGESFNKEVNTNGPITIRLSNRLRIQGEWGKQNVNGKSEHIQAICVAVKTKSEKRSERGYVIGEKETYWEPKKPRTRYPK